MAVTLTNQSALAVMRSIRSEGACLHDADTVSLAAPMPWAGKHWTAHNFDSDVWRWERPSGARPLHVAVPCDKT